jgi:hypothetical protein
MIYKMEINQQFPSLAPKQRNKCLRREWCHPKWKTMPPYKLKNDYQKEFEEINNTIFYVYELNITI